ncbi:MAG: hypothetical protein Q7R53_02555 [bacterium]|nr:hypothetical protein [bacterium]
MNRETAREALERGDIVKIFRIGSPDHPYVGELTGELKDGTFMFRGNSRGETIEIKVISEKIFLGGG